LATIVVVRVRESRVRRSSPASRRRGCWWEGTYRIPRASGDPGCADPGFTKKYGVTILVWFEVHETRESALARERAMKKWNRAWKIELIEKENSGWNDLSSKIPL